MNYSTARTFARELRKNQTKAEAIFWSKVRGRRFLGYKFNRQFIIAYKRSNYFIADFHCFEKKLIIEIDGKIHLKELEQDRFRDCVLIELGYTVLRFKNEEVLNTWEKVEAKLFRELKKV